jgi:hypothetical protein
VSLNSEIDILLADARYLLANNAIYREYRNSIANLIHTWCSINIEDIQNLLLEQTRIYYYPSTTFNSIKVQVNKGKIIGLSSEVYFKIKLFLKSSIPLDKDLKEAISEDIVNIVDNYLTNKNINIDDILLLIKNKYSSLIDSVQIKGLNDNIDLYNVEILQEQKRFNLKKKLVLESDGNVYVVEDIDIEYLVNA